MGRLVFVVGLPGEVENRHAIADDYVLDQVANYPTVAGRRMVEAWCRRCETPCELSTGLCE